MTKSLGLVRIGTVLHVGLRELLPWRRLAGIASTAIVSAAPALWLQARVAWPSLLTFVTAAAVYGATYALLSYAQARAGARRASAQEATGVPVRRPIPVERTL